MGDLTSCIQAAYSTQELLENVVKGLLGIDISDENYYIFSDEDRYYLLVFIPELEEEKRRLIESMGFEYVDEDIWIFKKPDVNVDELKECLLPKLVELQKYYWAQLIDLFTLVNERSHRLCGKQLFPVTYNKFELPLKWTGKLTLSEEEFIVFTQDMNRLFREGFREFFGNELGRRILENMSINYRFINTLGSLRNYYGSTHDTSNWNPRYIERARNNLARLSGSEYPSEWYHFVKAQLSLINEGIEFLEELLDGGLDGLCELLRKNPSETRT